MISEKEVMVLFEKAQKTNSQKDYDNSDISIIEYFIQEIIKILKSFNNKNRKKNIKELRFFYLNFEKSIDSDDPTPENYLESDILDLFLKLYEESNKSEIEQLLKEAEELLKKYKKK